MYRKILFCRYTIHGQDTFKCLTIDYTPGGKTLTIGNKGSK